MNNPAIRYSTEVYVTHPSGLNATFKVSRSSPTPLNAEDMDIDQMLGFSNLTGWRLMTGEEVEEYRKEEREQLGVEEEM